MIDRARQTLLIIASKGIYKAESRWGGGVTTIYEGTGCAIFWGAFFPAENKFWGIIFGKMTSSHKFWGVILEK